MNDSATQDAANHAPMGDVSEVSPVEDLADARSRAGIAAGIFAEFPAIGAVEFEHHAYGLVSRARFERNSNVVKGVVSRERAPSVSGVYGEPPAVLPVHGFLNGFVGHKPGGHVLACDIEGAWNAWCDAHGFPRTTWSYLERALREIPGVEVEAWSVDQPKAIARTMYVVSGIELIDGAVRRGVTR